jgi:hypothetical protein
MSKLEILAATLNAAHRNALDLAPVEWEQLSERDRAAWLAVAAAVPAVSAKK